MENEFQDNMRDLNRSLAAMNEHLAVMIAMQDRHLRLVKEHEEWLASHTKALRESDERMARLELNLDKLSVLVLKFFGRNGH